MCSPLGSLAAIVAMAPDVGHRVELVGREVGQGDERAEVLDRYHRGRFKPGRLRVKPERRPGARPGGGRSQRVDLGPDTGPNCWRKVGGHLFGRRNGGKDIADLGQLDDLSSRPDLARSALRGTA